MKKKKEIIYDIINKWAKDHEFTGYKWTIHVIMYEIYGRNIYIYTDRPGIIIGRGGRDIYDLKKRLEENHIRKKVDIIELRSAYSVEELKVKRRLF